MRKYSGAQTEKAVNNFPKTCGTVHLELIFSIVKIKKAAAKGNLVDQKISQDVFDAIAQSCDEILSGRHNSEFITSSIQGGAGTSINMNINEVIANRASEILNNEIVHPNDHVNLSQSTNDVNPSALRITTILLLEELTQNINYLADSLRDKAQKYKDIKKLARTHIQDAIPTSYFSTFNSYADTLSTHINKINDTRKYLQKINLGGTAIGNELNASRKYIDKAFEELNNITGLELSESDNKMSATSSSSDFVEIASKINNFFIDLNKIASDIRFLSSGPKGGIGEIILDEMQKGSSIMPGKINPVIPETVNQVYYYINGKYTTIQKASENSHLELSIMFPVLADSLISIMKIAIETTVLFNEKCIKTLRVNLKQTEQNLENSTAFSTILSSIIGYDKTTEAVRISLEENKSLRKVITEDLKLMTKTEFEKIINLTE